MNTKLITAAAALALVPVLAFAQVGANVNASVTAQAPGAQLRVHASSTLSAAFVATAKSRADKELDRRVAALNGLITRINAMTRVSADFKAQVTANLQNQISALNTLKANIDAETDDATLKSDVQSIVSSYRVFALVLPQANLAAAADRAIDVATMESALGAKLKARIDTAAAAGADVSALNTALADLATQVTSASNSAQAAVSVSLNLQPDQGDKTVQASNTKALQEARGDIQSAHKALVQGRKDIETIMQGLKKIHVAASATASSSVQAQ